MANPLKAALDSHEAPERIELSRAEHSRGISVGGGHGLVKTVQRQKGALHLFFVPAWQTIVIETSYNGLKIKRYVPYSQFNFTEEFSAELEAKREEQRAMSKRIDEEAKLARMVESAKFDDTVKLT